MTLETLALIAEYGPFTPFHPADAGDAWTVRDRTGYDIATTDDEDTARAIADALNHPRQ